MEPPDVFVLCVLFVMLVVSLSVLAAGEAAVQAKRNRRSPMAVVRFVMKEFQVEPQKVMVMP